MRSHVVWTTGQSGPIGDTHRALSPSVSTHVLAGKMALAQPRPLSSYPRHQRTTAKMTPRIPRRRRFHPFIDPCFRNHAAFRRAS